MNKITKYKNFIENSNQVKITFFVQVFVEKLQPRLRGHNFFYGEEIFSITFGIQQRLNWIRNSFQNVLCRLQHKILVCVGTLPELWKVCLYACFFFEKLVSYQAFFTVDRLRSYLYKSDSLYKRHTPSKWYLTYKLHTFFFCFWSLKIYKPHSKNIYL